MYINVTYDSSITSSIYAVNIELAIQTAVDFFDQTFSNPITINIDFGYGEENGNSITNPNAIAQSQSNGDYFFYSQVKSALAANAHTLIDQVAVATLPGSDPTGGNPVPNTGNFYVARSEEKALGLISGNDSGIDGYVGLSSSYLFWVNGVDNAIGDPQTSINNSENDAVGALEHEISEVMGRTGSLGQKYNGGLYQNVFTPLDMFRYLGPANHDLTPGAGRYFSINGVNMLYQYADATSAGSPDTADWAPNVVDDSYGYGSNNAVNAVSPTDIAEMNVLGYQPYNQIIDIPISLSAGEILSSAEVTSGGSLTIQSGAVVIDTTMSGDISRVAVIPGGSGGGTYSSTTIFASTNITVSSGGIASAITVLDGGDLEVDPNGTAINTIVYSGGSETVIGGTTLSGSGVVNVYGSSTNTFVVSGGKSIVAFDGVTVSAEVDSGGTQYVSSGGTAVDTTLLFSGTQRVEDGGFASGTQVNGGTLLVDAGASATSATLFGGTEISRGSTLARRSLTVAARTFHPAQARPRPPSALAASNGIHRRHDKRQKISAGGSQTVSSGGATTATIVEKDGVQTVLANGTAVGTIVSSAGEQVVNLDGTASGGIVSSGGFLEDNGFVSGTTVSTNGTLDVLANGIARFVTVNGGVENVGNYDLGATIINNGEQYVAAYMSAASVLLSAGGAQYVSGTAVNAVVASGGFQFVVGGGNQVNYGAAFDTTVSNGGYQEITSGSQAQQNCVFLTGGVQAVRVGATVNETFFSGGTQEIFSGAVVANALVSAGFQDIYSGGSANGTVLLNVGVQGVYIGGIVTNTNFSGGTQIIFSGADVGNTHRFERVPECIFGWASPPAARSWSRLAFKTSLWAEPRAAPPSQVAESRMFSDKDINAIVNDGGTQFIGSGGIVSNTVLRPSPVCR